MMSGTLRALHETDVPWIAGSRHADERVSMRHLTRGTTPSPEELSRRIWSGVEAQFVVTSAVSDMPAVLAQITEVDYRSSRGNLDVVVNDGWRGSGEELADGWKALLEHCGSHLTLESLYLHCLATAYDLVRGWLPDHEVVAVYPGYERVARDRSEDVVVVKWTL